MYDRLLCDPRPDVVAYRGGISEQNSELEIRSPEITSFSYYLMYRRLQAASRSSSRFFAAGFFNSINNTYRIEFRPYKAAYFHYYQPGALCWVMNPSRVNHKGLSGYHVLYRSSH